MCGGDASSDAGTCCSRFGPRRTRRYATLHEPLDQDARAQTLSGNAAVVNAVSKDRNGVGYGGVAFAKGVKALAIKKDAASAAFAPDFARVADGSYPISRFLYWYLPNEPGGEVKRLVDWVTSEEGQELVKEVGYFPAGAVGEDGR